MVFMVRNLSEMDNFQEVKVTKTLAYTSYHSFMLFGVISHVRDAYLI